MCGGVTIMQLREELIRALMEANNDDEMRNGIVGVSPESFNDLVKDMTSKRQDIKAFAFKTKAMVTTIHHYLFSNFVFFSCFWVVSFL